MKNFFKKRGKTFNNTTLLIVLCWSVYTCSYLGKLGYNANITQMEEMYSVSHATAGMVSSFFFFAYGIGQIFNGIFCKKYNIRFVVLCSLLVSGFMNILVGISDSFTLIKYYWLINGAALSVIWPSLIRLLSETLDKENIGRAVVAMGTTVATGTFFVYGLSALFVAFASYTIIFFVAGVLLPLIAVIWFSAYPNLVRTEKEQSEESTLTSLVKTKKNTVFWISVCILALFAVVDNLVKDGLTTWVPMILKEMYSLPDYISILLTLILPILAIFGTSTAVMLHKKIKDFILLSTTLFFVATILIGVVILCSPIGLVIVTLGCLGVIACLMSGVNNIITSMAPLYWKDRMNSGRLAGILNGFCYLGSTLSSYSLGVVADFGGWNAVFRLLFVLCIISVVIGCFYLLGKLCANKSKESEPVYPKKTKD